MVECTTGDTGVPPDVEAVGQSGSTDLKPKGRPGSVRPVAEPSTSSPTCGDGSPTTSSPAAARSTKRLPRSVAEDRELLALQLSALPHAHLPPMLLAGGHYLLLEGAGHDLADVYAGRSTAAAAPLFRDLCLGHRDELVEVLNARTVQTNEVGRSALFGPALTWAAGGEPVQLVDVGCSAGSTSSATASDSTTGPSGERTGGLPVRVDCTVTAGRPPIAPTLP